MNYVCSGLPFVNEWGVNLCDGLGRNFGFLVAD